MESMYLTVNAAGRIAPAFLTLIISVYLLCLTKKTLRTYLLAGYFLMVSVFHFGHLFAYAMLDPVGRWGWYLVATGVFSAVFKIRFGYHIPRNSFPREERLVFWISVALVGSAWIEYLIRAGLASTFYPENQTYGSPFVSTSLPIVLFVILIWSIIVLLRQYIQRDANNRAALVFLGLTLIELGLTIFLILQRAGVLPAGPDTTEMIMNFSLVVLYFLYALFYLNLTSEPSSFIAKLVGISLITLVTILSGLGVLQIKAADASYDSARADDTFQALTRYLAGQPVNPPRHQQKNADGDLDPGSVQYISSLDAKGNTKLLYAFDKNINYLEAQTVPTTGHRLYRRLNDAIFVTYQERGATIPGGKADMLYEVGYDYRAYRKSIHDLASDYAYAILLTIAFMLTVFPLFFRATVTAPLKLLLGRLQDAGIPREEDTAGTEDDLVFLSRSFSRMMRLLKEAKSQFYEYSEHIEEVEQSIQSFACDDPICREAGDRNIVYASAAMRDVIAEADRFAPFDQPVLVTGETGTGKELIARLLHHAAPHHAAPFVDVNCAAIADPLWESEIFGHIRGAFTDASASRPGRVAEAADGTLFFDEIGEMPLGMQAKMLRLLQERMYRPVGSDKAVQARCRFVFATNRDLITMVQKGEFREDLYYRINVFQIKVPPLRNRPADILVLVKHFHESMCRKHGMKIGEVDPAATEALASYHWPGNIRELENVLVRALAVGEPGQLQLNDLPASLLESARSRKQAMSKLRQIDPTANGRSSKHGTEFSADWEEGLSFDERIKDYSRFLIRQALDRSGGNKAQAAEILKMKRGRLRYQINDLKISD